MESNTIERSIREAMRNAPHKVTLSEGDERFVVLVLPVIQESKNDGLDKPWKRIFIQWLAKGKTVKVAAELSGVTRHHAHRCRRTDPVFREAWEVVKAESK